MVVGVREESCCQFWEIKTLADFAQGFEFVVGDIRYHAGIPQVCSVPPVRYHAGIPQERTAFIEERHIATFSIHAISKLWCKDHNSAAIFEHEGSNNHFL